MFLRFRGEPVSLGFAPRTPRGGGTRDVSVKYRFYLVEANAQIRTIHDRQALLARDSNLCVNCFYILDFCSDIIYNTIVATKGGESISEQKKMGRPTDHPKATMFRVRLDEESIQKLKESAESLKITKSEVVREGIDLVHESLKK